MSKSFNQTSDGELLYLTLREDKDGCQALVSKKATNLLKSRFKEDYDFLYYLYQDDSILNDLSYEDYDE